MHLTDLAGPCKDVVDSQPEHTFLIRQSTGAHLRAGPLWGPDHGKVAQHLI